VRSRVQILLLPERRRKKIRRRKGRRKVGRGNRGGSKVDRKLEI
jgi:hypothetical protein